MTVTDGFAVFDTAVGSCGVAWRARGLTRLQLPGGDAVRMRAWLRDRFADAAETAPSAEVGRALDAIGKLLAGEPDDLRWVALDLGDVAPFSRRVYEATREIPPGDTSTYGEVAAAAGSPGAARAVGQALARNPVAIVVPCHRVLASGGRLGGFSADGGAGTKARLLALEGTTAPGSG